MTVEFSAEELELVIQSLQEFEAIVRGFNEPRADEFRAIIDKLVEARESN